MRQKHGVMRRLDVILSIIQQISCILIGYSMVKNMISSVNIVKLRTTHTITGPMHYMI